MTFISSNWCSERRSLLAILMAGLLVLTAVTTARAGTSDNTLEIGDALPSAMMQQLHDISLRDIGQSDTVQTDALKTIDDAPKTQGKPFVLYVGAEFCPYCAAMRWPLMLALMRFGQFSGVEASRSSSTDVYADTATVTFVNARYDSDWIDLRTVEVADRNGDKLESPNDAQIRRLRTYDKAPYTQSPGSIPFVDIDDQWIQVGSPVHAGLYADLDWSQVVDQLQQGDGDLWAAVLGEADLLTQALCQLTDGQPEQVCSPLEQ